MLRTMDLFAYEARLEFPKIAGLDLGEDQNQWARRVLVDLYRTLPEASQYAPQVEFLRTDEEQGFALGVVTLGGNSQSAISAVPEESQSTNSVHIPIIVKGHVMAPLDIMVVQGKLLPLNAERLREALFRPMGFDLLTDDWGDTSILGSFQLPGRSDIYPNSGFAPSADGGSVTTMFGPGIKNASYQLLHEIADTILQADQNRFAANLENPQLFKQACENPVFLGGLKVISEAALNAGDREDLLKTASGAAGIDVVQISYSDTLNSYIVKSASRGAYTPHNITMTRTEAVKFAGDLLQKVDTEGAVTIADPADEASGADPREEAWDVVDTAGLYRVKTIEGEELTGWVFPSLLDFDGIQVPMTVFTNGEQAAVQDQVVGVSLGDATTLPGSKQFTGTGLFYFPGPEGLEATVPVEIVGTETGMDGGTVYHVNALTDGSEHRVCVIPGRLQAMKAIQGELYVPEGTEFVPLTQEQAVVLVSEPDGVQKTASALVTPTIRIHGFGDISRLEMSHLPKLAAAFHGEIPTESAVFALCLAGLSAPAAQRKVAAAQDGPVVVHNVRDIRTLEDLRDSVSEKAAAASRQVLKMRHDLTKEASVLPDVHTVDAVLSLGLLNSENIRVYVSKLPYLEKALGMVCHLLLASRLGLSEVPEYPAARCVRGLDEVCRGLRDLGLREATEDTDA